MINYIHVLTWVENEFSFNKPYRLNDIRFSLNIHETLLYWKRLRDDYCPYKVSLISNPVAAIATIDDQTNYIYAIDVERASMQKMLYLSDERICTMLRIAYGL